MITKAPEKTGDKWLDLLAALRSDLEHAAESRKVSERNFDEHSNEHRYGIHCYATGYHDAIKQVIDLVERTVERR